MIEALIKSIAQLNDKAIQKTLLSSVAATAALFIAVWFVIGYLLTDTALFTWGWLDTIVDFMGGLATLVITWFLFPGIVTAVIALFLDDVARAVEARHYPGLPSAAGTTVGETVIASLRFVGVLVVLNIFMLLFLIFPPVFPFVFYSVNGYLLGREYFELVSLRRMELARAREIRKQRQGTLFVFGICIALLLTIPVVNLLTPIIATAAMVHLFEKWRHALPEPSHA